MSSGTSTLPCGERLRKARRGLPGGLPGLMPPGLLDRAPLPGRREGMAPLQLLSAPSYAATIQAMDFVVTSLSLAAKQTTNKARGFGENLNVAMPAQSAPPAGAACCSSRNKGKGATIRNPHEGEGKNWREAFCSWCYEETVHYHISQVPCV